jgi:putative ABC transport system permease protein
VITLGIGVAVTTAVFGAVNAIWFRPLPYPAAERLVVADELHPRHGRASLVSPATFEAWRGSAGAFEAIGSCAETAFAIAAGGAADRVAGVRVSASLLRLLDARPVAGRTLAEADERPDAAPVVMIGERLWRRQFESSPDVVGRTVKVDGAATTIVGVLPSSFRVFNSSNQVFAPPATAAPRDRRSLRVVARLRPGVAIDGAAAELRALAVSAGAGGPDEGVWRPGLRPLDEVMWADARPVYVLLLVAAALLLALVAANVANLLLARAEGRRQEFAIRVVCGAGPLRLMRQLLTEGLFLAFVAGAIGLLTCVWLRQILVATFPEMTELVVDARVFGFAFAASLVSGMALGFAPAASVSVSDPGVVLGSGAPIGSSTRHRLGRVLAAAQLAVAAALIGGGGLLFQAASGLRSIDPGFDSEHLLTARVDLPGAAYAGSARRLAFYDEARARLTRLAGVQMVAVVSELPLNGGLARLPIEVSGTTAPPGASLEMAVKAVEPAYFRTLAIARLAGDGFTQRDGPGAPPVAVVNRTLARALWGSEAAAVGSHIRVGDDPWRRIAGVVADARQVLTEPPASELYLPIAQQPATVVSFVIRTAGDPMTLAPAVHATIRSVDPDVPVSDLWSMTMIVDGYFPAPIAAAFGGVGVVSLALGAIGLYGTVAFLTARRTREFGVRLALGAGRARLVRAVLLEGLRLTAAGTAAGLVCATLVGLALSRRFEGVRPADPGVFATVALTLAVVSLAACLVPAWRAGRMSPSTALRCE